MKISRLVLAVAAAVATQAAHADKLIVDFDYLGGGYDYTASLVMPFAQPITASPFLVNNLTTASSFVAFCIEAFVPLSLSAQTTGNSTYTAATPYIIGAVQSLYNGYYANALTSGTEAAAFQFALWELVEESSMAANASSMTNGNFAFVNPADPAVVRAQQMLNGVGAASNNYALFSYRTSNVGGDLSQDILTATPVPEVSTYAMMAAGLAFMGAAARRRKS